MFLDAVQTRNPALIDAAVDLHRSGRIGPDTYVLDLDAIRANARGLAQAAGDASIELWQVGKQFGRSAAVYRAVGEHIRAAAVIDERELAPIRAAGVELGNVGHLVQIPRRRLPSVLAAGAQHVTVTDLANLRAVDEAAAGLGIVQDVLVKVSADPHDLYPGQSGGIAPQDAPRFLEDAARLTHVRVAGVTGFPCILFRPERGPVATATAGRVLQVAELLSDPVIDLPSHTSCSSIGLLASLGATHGEPGHALTGTTPQHAVDLSLTETPAYVYVSEIGQVGQPTSVFGGGFYPRGHARNALVVDGEGERQRLTLAEGSPGNIDYYREVDIPPDARVGLGDTAVMAFRTQIFVVRSLVALIEGISRGEPHLVGMCDAAGREIQGEWSA